MTNSNLANANQHLKISPFKIQQSNVCRPKHMTVREPKRMKSKTNLVNHKKKTLSDLRSSQKPQRIAVTIIKKQKHEQQIQWKHLRLVAYPIT